MLAGERRQPRGALRRRDRGAVPALPGARRAARLARGLALRRPAADARVRARAPRASPGPAARRAVHGALADPRAADLRHGPGDPPRGRDHPARRAERAARARHLGLRLRARARAASCSRVRRASSRPTRASRLPTSVARSSAPLRPARGETGSSMRARRAQSALLRQTAHRVIARCASGVRCNSMSDLLSRQATPREYAFPHPGGHHVKLKALGAALLFSSTTALAQTTPPAAAPAAPAAPTFTFALKGFVSMSAAYQNGSFLPSDGPAVPRRGEHRRASPTTRLAHVRRAAVALQLLGEGPAGHVRRDADGGPRDRLLRWLRRRRLRQRLAPHRACGSPTPSSTGATTSSSSASRTTSSSRWRRRRSRTSASRSATSPVTSAGGARASSASTTSRSTRT